MRPIRVTVGPLAAAAANNLAASQSVAGAGSVNLGGVLVSGGVATLDTPRRVLITSAGNDSGITFTVVGTTWGGAAVTETLAGANATSTYTATDFATVSSITTSGSTASTVQVGTNGVASSAPIRFDEWAVGNIAIQATVSGTVNYTVQATLDDPNSPFYPVAVPSMTWVASADTNVVSATASAQSNYIVPPVYARVLLNSGSGSVTATFTQAGVNPR